MAFHLQSSNSLKVVYVLVLVFQKGQSGKLSISAEWRAEVHVNVDMMQ